MIEEVLSCVMTFDLTENTDIDLTAYGFTVKEAFKHYNQKGLIQIDDCI